MRREFYDWPSRADERRRAFGPEVIDVRVVRQRQCPNLARVIFIAQAPIVLWRLKGDLLMAAAMLGALH
jgi:hypothetical protein